MERNKKKNKVREKLPGEKREHVEGKLKRVVACKKRERRGQRGDREGTKMRGCEPLEERANRRTKEGLK